MIDVGLILFLGWKPFIVDSKTCESPIEGQKVVGMFLELFFLLGFNAGFFNAG